MSSMSGLLGCICTAFAMHLPHLTGEVCDAHDSEAPGIGKRLPTVGCRERRL